MATLNVAARYVALFLQASSYAGYSSQAQIPHTPPRLFPLSFLLHLLCPTLTGSKSYSYVVFYSWISTSFPRPPAKRAVAIAIINAFSQLGNVAGSYVWDLSDNGYRKSYGIVTAMFGISIVGCLVFRMCLLSLNKNLEEAENEANVQADEPNYDGLVMSKGFRYLV